MGNSVNFNNIYNHQSWKSAENQASKIGKSSSNRLVKFLSRSSMVCSGLAVIATGALMVVSGLLEAWKTFSF